MSAPDIAALLREALKKSGLKQVEVARRMGVSPPVVSRLLNKPNNVELKTLVSFALACGMRLRLDLYDKDLWAPPTAEAVDPYGLAA